jgi:hypothetical protein
MARSPKNFGSGTPQKKRDPITFILHDEEFTAVPQIQGALLIQLVKDSQSEDTSKAASVILNFLDEVLEEESLDRFKELTHSKDRFVDMETLASIVAWLVEEYTNRPEEQRGA